MNRSRISGAWLALALIPGAACSSNTPVTAIDAATPADAPVIADAGVLADTPVSLSWVDFAVTGCALTGPDAGMDAGVAAPCTGTAPLELRFTAVAPAPIDTYVWTFGDGQGSDEPSPVHTYGAPGSFEVSLTVAGPRGTASLVKPDLVAVTAATAGARCTDTSQCSAGLECRCSGDSCAPGLDRGLCTTGCGTMAPCAVGVCADLAAGAPANPAPWQQSLCLAECASDAGCPDGLTCQELPGPDGTWVQACFVPGLLRPVGASCLDASGAPDHAACASGFCATLGARGMCSTPCQAGQCPASAACARFNGGAELCVARCETQTSCTADPWLACEAPESPGTWGFSLDEPAAEPGYCAPRTCATPADCGVDGACNGGFCGP